MYILWNFERTLFNHVVVGELNQQFPLLRGASEPCQTSKMECFVKIFNGFYSLTFVAKQPILDVWQDSAYTFDIDSNNSDEAENNWASPQVLYQLLIFIN